MPVTGSYAQLVAFLGRLERSGHFVTVDKVVLRSDAEGQAPVLQLTLSSYFVADDEEVTDASAR